MFFSAECYDLVDLLKGDNPGMSASLQPSYYFKKNQNKDVPARLLHSVTRTTFLVIDRLLLAFSRTFSAVSYSKARKSS